MGWMKKQYIRFEQVWNCESRHKKVSIFLCAYTVAFLVAFMIAYSPWIITNKTLILPSDGRTQHYPLMVYVGRSIRRLFFNALHGKFSVPLFDLSFGVGGDIIGPLNSLGCTDPLVLLSAFIPTKYSEYLYCFLAILRIYIAGLSFSYLCRYFNKRTLYTLIGGIVYCFSAYALFCSVRHPFFINPMILLPLLIVGTDKILKKKKPYFFIVAVSYSALCGYYHVYMMTIMISVYALVRFFDLYKEKRLKEFSLLVARGLCDYCLGVGIAAVLFVPAVFSFLGGERSGFSNYNPASYTSAYFLNRLLRLIAPSTGSGWTYPAFAAILLFALILLFFSRDRHTLKILTVITLSTWLSSFGCLIMNGFQYASARWTFGLTLLMAYIVVEMLPDLLALSSKQRIICAAIVCVYGVIVFSTASARKLKYATIGICFLALTLLVLTFALRETHNEQVGQISVSMRFGTTLRSFACLFLVIANVGILGIYMYSPDQGNIAGSYAEFGYEKERLANAIEREVEPYLLADPYLPAQPEGRADSSSFTKNISLVWRIPGMLNYSAAVNKYISEFWEQIENCGTEQSFLVFSTDQRTIINTLLSEKYHVESEKNTHYVPYGYAQIEKTKKGNLIYENIYALPWGYTYDTVISYGDLNGMDGVQKQEAMLQAIALEDGVSGPGSDTILFDERLLPYEIECKNCTWEDGKLTVSKENATITLKCSIPADVEGYVRLSGFDINDSKLASFKLKVVCGSIVKTSLVASHLYSWYYGREDYLFNLGYSEEERTGLTITFPSKGTFKLNDIELYALPMDNYPERIEALRAEPLENIQWGTNCLSGTVDLSKDKVLCLSVPYSAGWSAIVDGEKADILRGNYMFMAVPLSAGHHNIEFHYRTPGIRLGMGITALSWGIVIVMLCQNRKRQHPNAVENAGD